jgi:hypothetical protein
MPHAHDQLRLDDRANAGPIVYVNPEHPKRIAEWIEKNWRHGECPICHSDQWATGGMFEVPAFAPIPGSPRAMVPVFPIGCVVCGHTLWINAVTANVVRTDEEQLFTVQQWEGQQLGADT